MVEPLIKTGQLFHMPDSPQFKLPTYMVYSLNSESLVLERVFECNLWVSMFYSGQKKTERDYFQDCLIDFV
jgi:hypothetical protein